MAGLRIFYLAFLFGLLVNVSGELTAVTVFDVLSRRIDSALLARSEDMRKAVHDVVKEKFGHLERKIDTKLDHIQEENNMKFEQLKTEISDLKIYVENRETGDIDRKVAKVNEQKLLRHAMATRKFISSEKHYIRKMLNSSRSEIAQRTEELFSHLDSFNKTLAASEESTDHVINILRDQLSIQGEYIANKSKERHETLINTVAVLVNKTQQDITKKMSAEIKNVTSIIQNKSQEQHDTLNTRIVSLSNKHTQLSNSLGNMNQKYDVIKRKLDSLERQVAFSVYYPRSTLTNDDVPTFHRTILNVGGGYNAATGKFTCPVAGIYIFNLSIRHGGNDKGEAFCWYRLNGTTKTFVTAYKDAHDQSSGTLIVNLNVGNVLDLKCGGWEHEQKFMGTTFSGVLINPS